MASFSSLLWPIQTVVFPVVLAGLIILFLYGIINYFVVGANDDDRKDMGRKQLLTADAGFITILIVVVVLQGALNVDLSAPEVSTSTGSGLNIPDSPPTER